MSIRRTVRRLLVLAVIATLLGGGWAFVQYGRGVWVPLVRPLVGSRTVAEVVASLDDGAGARMRAALAQAGVPARPERLWLVGFKHEKRLELWAESAAGVRVLVRSFPVLAASGKAGPKLREGDKQVPEGVYRIDGLNPNSAYHLSLRVDYPNAADKARAAREGRTRLGGDIFIHGKAASVGCLAIGDDAAEELFWLAATRGREAFTVVIVPTDLRRNPKPDISEPAWVGELYRDLALELARFRAIR